MSPAKTSSRSSLLNSIQLRVRLCAAVCRQAGGYPLADPASIRVLDWARLFMSLVPAAVHARAEVHDARLASGVDSFALAGRCMPPPDRERRRGLVNQGTAGPGDPQRVGPAPRPPLRFHRERRT